MKEIKETKGKKTDAVAQVAAAPAAAAAASADMDASMWEQYSEGQSTGFEQVAPEDLGVPFLSIVQDKGPEFCKSHEDYATKKIEGVQPGDVINTVTREIVHREGKEPCIVVPCGYEKTYIEWKPRGQGGGLVKVHRDDRILNEVTGRDDKNKDLLRNGNNLQTTHSYFVILLRKGEKPSRAQINMASSQLKHSRFWLNLMTNIKLGPNRVVPPMYSHTYCLKTVIERNEEGNWYGWNISIGEMVRDRELAEAGKAICENIQKLAKRQLASQEPVKQLANQKAKEDDVPM